MEIRSHCHSNPNREAVQAVDTRLLPSSTLQSKECGGSLLGHTGEQRIDLEGQRKIIQQNCPLSEGGSLGQAVALYRLSPVLRTTGRGHYT